MTRVMPLPLIAAADADDAAMPMMLVDYAPLRRYCRYSLPRLFLPPLLSAAFRRVAAAFRYAILLSSPLTLRFSLITPPPRASALIFASWRDAV